MKSWLKSFSIAILMALLVTSLSWAAPHSGSGPVRAGDLDLSFGYGGYYVGPDNGTFGGPTAFVADGKILVSGSYAIPGYANKSDLLLVQFDSSGFPDESFGTFGGMAFVDFNNDQDYGGPLAVMPNGKIMVAGTATINQVPNLALAQFTPEGALDAGFGQDGKVTTNFPNSTFTHPTSIYIDSGEMITVCGIANDDFFLARFNPNGSPDVNFGVGGKVSTDFNGHSDTAIKMKMLTGGKILVAGTAVTGSSGNTLSAALAQYTSGGVLDPAFGAGGKRTTSMLAINDLLPAPTPDLVFLPDGKILVKANLDPNVILMRLNSDGTADTGFGPSGKVTINIGQGNWIEGITLQSDGKIILTGAQVEFGPYTRRFLIMRLMANGSPDSTFGISGKVITDFPYLLADAGSATILPDNHILIVGGAYSTYHQIALARYFGDSKVYLPLISNP